MGCDIHGCFQQRYTYGDEKWETLALVPRSRNYLLFAALADVRNYHGVTPISAPRGLPADIGEVAALEFFGDHSFTYFSLKELLEWTGWDQTVIESGYVERPEYEAAKAEGRHFKMWSQEVYGGKIIKATEDQIALGYAPEGYNYVFTKWSFPLRERVPHFMKLLDYLRDECNWWKDEKPHIEYRLVIGFDS